MARALKAFHSKHFDDDLGLEYVTISGIEAKINEAREYIKLDLYRKIGGGVVSVITAASIATMLLLRRKKQVAAAEQKSHHSGQKHSKKRK